MKKSVAALALSVGAMSASAAVVGFETSLAPETLTATGSGDVTILYDTITHDLTIEADWFGLSSPTTVAHIHCCLASPGTNPLTPPFGGSPVVGVAVTPGTLPGFPAGVTSGHYEVTLDLDLASSFTAAFVSNFGGGTIDGARDALLAAMGNSRAYFNIHTQANPGGEIRGFIPEPGSLALAALAIGAIGGVRRRRGARPL